VGCCGLSPVIVINDEVYGKVTKERLPEILAKHRGQENSKESE
jgi:NADH-quinone oxidoreductase subunit E